MKAIVTSIDKASGRPQCDYVVVSDSKSCKIKSNILLSLLEKVDVSDAQHIVSEGNAEPKECGLALANLEKKIAITDNIEAVKDRNSAFEHVELIIPDLQGLTNTLLHKLVSGAPIIVRFHKDGDGGSGATAIYNAVNNLISRSLISPNIFYRANRSVAYEQDSLIEDITLFDLYECVEKPLLMIIDFGTSEECHQRIIDASNKFDIIMIDHHVQFTDNFGNGKITYINSWNYECDSNMTAGLLGCIIAEILCGEQMDLLKKVSLISDYSKYANRDEQNAANAAIAIDYLASKKNYMEEFTPKQINNLITDKLKLAEVSSFAKNAIEDAIGYGMKHLKEHGLKVKIYVIDFKHIIENGSYYPPPGRFSSLMQGTLEERSGECVTIIYYGKHISLRASKSLTNRLNLLEIINKVQSISPYVLSGGGHLNAAGVKCEENRAAEVVKLILAQMSAIK